MIGEYVNNGDLVEALKDFDDFNPIESSQYEDLIRAIAQYILEKSEALRTAVGKLFLSAIQQKKLDIERFVGGWVKRNYILFWALDSN